MFPSLTLLISVAASSNAVLISPTATVTSSRPSTSKLSVIEILFPVTFWRYSFADFVASSHANLAFRISVFCYNKFFSSVAVA
jgi:hypothetical protein